MKHRDARYNAAADFLDRHLEAGRGQRIAIRTLSQMLTYEELAAASARFGRALADLGIEVENRVLLGAAAGSSIYIDCSWAEVAIY